MKSRFENGPDIADKSTAISLLAASTLAVDLTAIVDRLEADIGDHRLAGPEIANHLHELRLRSERLFGAA